MTQTTSPLPAASGSPADRFGFSQPVPPAFGGPSTPPPLPPSDPPPSNLKDGASRPGWRGVIAVGAGAAVLSSLLTAGVVTAIQPDAGTQVGVTGGSTNSSTGSNSAPPVAAGSATNPNWVAVAAAVEPSVVSVRVAAGGRSGGEGSGVVIDTQGRILTNHHVIESATSGGQLSVVLSDGRTYAATVVGTDPSTDLAVIALDDPPSGLKAAAFGDSSAVKVGEPVMALGNPLGLSDTVTTGIVSALDRPVTTGGSQQQNPFGGGAGSEPVVTNAIQTDAAVNPGNSGGALVNGRGQVIGITSSIASLGASQGGQSGSIGLGFAIPANEAKAVAEQLIANKSVQHAFLGVTLADGTATVDGAQRQAAVIGSVTSGTPAAKAGLQARDAVIAMDGKPVDGAESLIARVRAARPDTEVTLTVVRNGAAREVTVTLAERPAS